MVANPPIERPESQDFLVNQLRELQQRVDELTRRSAVPFQAGKSLKIYQDPNNADVTDLEIQYGDGTPSPVLTVKPGASGIAQWAIWDRAGHVTFFTDDLAGYGLATPINHVSFQYWDPPAMGSASTSETVVQYGFIPVINPGFQFSMALKSVASSGSLAGRGRVHIYDPGTGYSSYSSYATVSGSGTQYVNGPAQAVQLPSAEIGRTLFVDVSVQVTSGTGTIYPTMNYATGAAQGVVNSVNFW
ncbi:hypothetical protein [Amycolatopsis sp. NPDC051371]|uniref:hypothetical protein n=1 Tax=Amycolatopsis sp. NPDC051371 TaxID=3155800 RepID=UPI0034348F41